MFIFCSLSNLFKDVNGSYKYFSIIISVVLCSNQYSELVFFKFLGITVTWIKPNGKISTLCLQS